MIIILFINNIHLNFKIFKDNHYSSIKNFLPYHPVFKFQLSKFLKSKHTESQVYTINISLKYYIILRLEILS